MHARIACVGERAWDVSASQVREIRRQGPPFSLLSSLPLPTRHRGGACDRQGQGSDYLMTSTWVIHPAESAPEESQKQDADSKSHPPAGSASGPERKTLTPVYQQCQGEHIPRYSR